MKTKLLIAGACILITVLVLIVIVIMRIQKNIDTAFANTVTLKYHYMEKNIDIIITDENDVQIIKENLKGISYTDNPSCGFSLDISITLSDGEKNIVFCPACDGCATARIGDSNRYIDIADKNKLESIWGKYGMVFSCV